MAKASDAFVVVREEVEASLEQAGRMFSQWQALPANSPTREQLGSELKTKLKSIQWDLEDLEETIQIVETQRERFQHLPESELASRKKFIEQSRTALQEMQRATSVKAAKAKQQQQQRADLMQAGTSYSRYDNLQQDIQTDNQGYIDSQMQHQETIMRTQDSQLEEVSQTIQHLRVAGEVIGDELDAQNDMLNDLDEDMEQANTRLMGTIKKIDKVLAISRDGKQSCLIFLLLVVLIVLIIVYTKS
eukprot:m.25877 g.25877  ORF g.25877 m.25877 type:complete len:246 (-) comp8776_c0_seq2:815-1552(-)